MAELPPWVRDVAGGAVLSVHARPGASRAGVAGTHAAAVAVRVRARAVEGKANAELLAVVAEVVGVPASAVTLDHGAHGREKRLRIAGVDAATVAARIAQHLLR